MRLKMCTIYLHIGCRYTYAYVYYIHSVLYLECASEHMHKCTTSDVLRRKSKLEYDNMTTCLIHLNQQKKKKENSITNQIFVWVIVFVYLVFFIAKIPWFFKSDLVQTRNFSSQAKLLPQRSAHFTVNRILWC